MSTTRPGVTEDGTPKEPEIHTRYRAFISYSHAVDRSLAVALQHGIQRLGRSWYQRPAFQVFRDDTSLAASPALWSDIESALDEAAFLILLGSPASASSAWVQREVQWWLANRPVGHLLIGVTDGDIRWDEINARFDEDTTTALPREIVAAFPQEPRWIDLRGLRGELVLDQRNPVFRDRVAEFAATLHGISKERLIGEDVRQHRRWVRLRTVGITLLAALALLATAASVLFLLQRNEAQRQTALAEAREFTARANTQSNPYAALVMAVEAVQRTDPPLAEARSSYARALQRVDAIGLRPDSLPINIPDRGGPVDWSPDGSTVALAGSDGSIWIWDPMTNQQIGQPMQVDPDERVQGRNSASSLDWSPDGTRLASADSNTSVIVFDVTTRQPLSRPRMTERSIGGRAAWGVVSWSPDGRTLAFTERGGTAALWDTVLDQPTGVRLAGHTQEIMSLDWSSDGSRLATGALDSTVRVWDAQSGGALATFQRSAIAIDIDVAWAPTGPRLAASDFDGEVSIWDTDNPSAPPTQLVGDTSRVRAKISWAPDGKRLASASTDGLRLWDTAKGGEIGQPFTDADAGLNGKPVTVAWNPRTDRLLTSQQDGSLRLWVPNGWPLSDGFSTRQPGPIISVAWSPDGTKLAAADGSGAIQVRDAVTGQTVAPVIASGATWSARMVWSRDGQQLAVAADDDTIRLFSAVTGTEIKRFVGHSAPVRQLAWSPAGDWLASASDNGEIWIWDATTGDPLGPVLSGDDRAIVALSWRSEGSEITSIDQAGVVRTWRFSDSALVETLRPTTELFLASTSWSPDGDRVAFSNGANDPVSLYDPRSGTVEASAVGRLGYVGDLTWSAAGHLIATSSANTLGASWLLDSERGEFIGSVSHGEDVFVRTARFSPDGTRLATGGSDGSVRIWDAVSESDACRMSVRVLDTDQVQSLLGNARGAPKCITGSIVSRAQVPVVTARDQ